ncbi:MAG: hypothetical protein HC819_19445 [Cyclobacteriaceae bacterium]|nr:hypothetical protein [Cyclobacteriaceae bacterium]
MVKNPLWFLLAFMGLISCHEKPTLPFTPKISIGEFYFRQIANETRDSIVLKINFEDGDGDLGLGAEETQFPFQILDFVITNGDTLRYGDNDTLPPYNCIDYEIFKDGIFIDGKFVVTKVDTMYVIKNPNHFNFFLTFMIKQPDGSFRAFDPAIERNCAPPYHGRFFILNSTGDDRPLTGELQYAFTSGFRLLFRNNIIKLRVMIQDRALNKSNIVETEEFNINDIIRDAI